MTGRRIQSSDNGMKAASDLSAMAVRATFGNDHAEAPASEVYRIKDDPMQRADGTGFYGIQIAQQQLFIQARRRPKREDDDDAFS